LIFHRVVPGFVIQGGGFSKDLVEKETKAPIKNEADNGLSNLRGSIAMARTREPDSATSQFYLNLRNNRNLDKENEPQRVGYCVFGKVIEGLDVVDKIGELQTATKHSKRGPMSDVPVEDAVIKTIRRVDTAN
jgi:cyclophilin family peptidyl-prolyl cis-trans isomerase